ncbi:50S ribosomal protein L9 [bacterium BMS3Bbin04]|nr:50S ribosomal protein L9 [bacterium BMS3Bbin04]
MKVILRESYESLGRTGDDVDVKPGFARNYLVPQGIAYPANRFYRKRFEAEREALLHVDSERRSRAEAVAERAVGAKVEFKVRVSERGQMFGAITNVNIADALAEQDIQIDRRKISLSTPIKTLGEHQVEIRPHGDVIFKVLVQVIPESAPEALRELSIRELVEGITEEELAAQAAEEAAKLAGEEKADEAAAESASEVVEMVEMVEARSDTEDEDAASAAADEEAEK